MVHTEWPRFYGVSAANRAPLIDFMLGALEAAGCRIIYRPPANRAPFVVTFETPDGERAGIVAYAFLANNEPIKHRPDDEHRFQIKYGGDLSGVHRVWQDPHGLYTTLLLGINPLERFFVAVDPVLHDPTRFSVSVEFKDEQVAQVQRDGWFAWERERRGGTANPHSKRTVHAGGDESDPLFEVLVGGRSEHFLRLIKYEQEAFREPAGERHLIADQLGRGKLVSISAGLEARGLPSAQRLHALAAEFQLSETKVLDLISERRMLKMAVRGSVAEEHLLSALRSVVGVASCTRLRDDGGPDVEVLFRGKRLTVECKNSSRQTSHGFGKIDLQRTRASKTDPCSRYYSPDEFHVVAACIHALTEKWEFRYAASTTLDSHRHCKGKLDNNVKLDQRWNEDPILALEQAARAA